MTTARKIRIGILLLVLGMVALDAWLTRVRTTSWEKPLRATLYPIAGDAGATTRDYVARLKRDDFVAIEDFLRREGARYGVRVEDPVRVRLAPPMQDRPPVPPAGGNPVQIAWWSLKLRAWAWRVESGQPRPHSQIRLFVLYYDPATHPRVEHSLGLQKGLIGVVHAFATRSMTPTNNIVIAHELLHTLGAADKYGPVNGLPRYPDGFAEPDRKPRYPQVRAEVMAGRVPVALDRAEIPEGLDDVVVGPATAREIGWAPS
jgi:hypothetical protein